MKLLDAAANPGGLSAGWRTKEGRAVEAGMKGFWYQVRAPGEPAPVQAVQAQQSWSCIAAPSKLLIRVKTISNCSAHPSWCNDSVLRAVGRHCWHHAGWHP